MLHTFAAVLALSDPTGPVVEARIADVIADPERYGGQTLRIRGQVDACYGFVCSICPEEMTPETAEGDRCLRMGFDDFEVRDDVEARNLGYWQSAVRLMEEGFRFSVVTAEGRFDPSCLPPPTKADVLEEIVVCTDRATTFRDARVSRVHRRLASNDGLVFDRRRDAALIVASQAVAAEAEAAYRDYVLTFDADPDWKPIAIFQTENPSLGDAAREAWACVCRIDHCSDVWPRREISLWARTANDPYFCYFALAEDGAWRIYPE